MLPVKASGNIPSGRLVMLLFTQGRTPVPASGDAGPFDLSGEDIGHFELGRVTSVTAGTLVLGAPLTRGFPSGAQVVAVPEYTDVTVQGGGAITADAWANGAGGVVAFLASGTVTVASGGKIHADARGFSGGALTSGDYNGCTGLDEPAPKGAMKGEGLARGPPSGYGNVLDAAGGGDCHNAGGGGGGNGGPGGRGGFAEDGDRPVGGLGGAKVLAPLGDRLFFGGGGGAGQDNGGAATAGGKGGGVVFIRARRLAGNGEVSADGETAANAGSDGAGGGGAGGTVQLRLATAADCAKAHARGGDGGNTSADRHGPGGGGGGGRVFLQSTGGSCSADVSSGEGGTQPDSGAPGGSHYGAGPADRTTNAGQSASPGGGFVVPAAPVLLSPANGSRLRDTRPALSGTAEPARTVAVVLDGAVLGRVTADPGGAFSLAPPSPLADGAHTAAAFAEDGGLASPLSNTSAFTIDATAPAPPLILEPADGSTIAEVRPVFRGSSEPDAEVAVYVDGALLGVAPLAGPGGFELPSPQALGEGLHAAFATAKDLAGNLSAASPTVTFTVKVGGGGGGGSGSGKPRLRGGGCSCGAPGLGLGFGLGLLAARRASRSRRPRAGAGGRVRRADRGVD